MKSESLEGGKLPPHTHIYTTTHIHTHIYTYTITLIHTHIYIYTIAHTYTHRYTYTHIYTFIQSHISQSKRETGEREEKESF